MQSDLFRPFMLQITAEDLPTQALIFLGYEKVFYEMASESTRLGVDT